VIPPYALAARAYRAAAMTEYYPLISGLHHPAGAHLRMRQEMK
jgi:hypothetical protein